MLARVLAALMVLLPTTFGGPTARAAAASAPTPLRVEASASAADVVGEFGDDLDQLHVLLSYEQDKRDAARIDRVCAAVLADYPALKAAVGTQGTDLLVAAESLVAACREGFAASLDTVGFEIINGDYNTVRELSFAFS